MRHLTLLLCFYSLGIFAQTTNDTGIYYAREFSKDKALYKAKEFVMEEIIGLETNVIKFNVDPLAETSSGELISLAYACEEKNMDGLVLGFFGNRWDNSGVFYQAFAFKNLPKKEAIEMLTKLNDEIELNAKYLSADSDNNNIYFQYEDITFLIYRDSGIKIRVFWQDFDAEWESNSFSRTKRRFEKKLTK